MERAYQSLIGFPLAWTPGTDGPVSAEAVLAPIHTEADLAKYKGKLRGKIVLMTEPKNIAMITEPMAHRLTAEEISARMSIPDVSRIGGFGPAPARGAGPGPVVPDRNAVLKLCNATNKFLRDEGALVVLNYGTNGDGGTVFATFGGSQDPKDPTPPPMVRLLRSSTTGLRGW